MRTIAILLTVHNRKEHTLTCLNHLFSQNIPGYQIDVYMTNDGCTDGTPEIVKQKFPSVKIISGNGNLFWNQGMRLAWDSALKFREYDFYLWINDDTILFDFAISELLQCYKEVLDKQNLHSLITGACKSSFQSEEFSYGGRTDKGPVIPNGEIQQCKYINGNVVLIPSPIFEAVGNLSSDYTHALGDFDYGLRVSQKGYKCFTSKKYVAICPPNPGIPGWCNPSKPLKERWKLIHSPKGLNIKEYAMFRRKFWGRKWIIYILKAYSRLLFPKQYLKFLK